MVVCWQVGLSGSGKSTLIHLLQRHYDPSEGRILLDGQPLPDLDAAWFRMQLGVVSQVRPRAHHQRGAVGQDNEGSGPSVCRVPSDSCLCQVMSLGISPSCPKGRGRDLLMWTYCPLW